MKATKVNKGRKLAKRSTMITMDDVLSKGVIVENGRGKVQIRPSLEMVGRKYGELVKTRTPARKRVVGGKANVAKTVKKPTKK